MKKRDVRAAQLLKLKSMSPDERVNESTDLYQQLFATSVWQTATTIGITLSGDLELPTRPIIERAWAESKQVAIPLTLPQRQMAFVAYTPATKLVLSDFHVWEPTATAPQLAKSTIDLLIVPGLAYALADHARVGFGGGYYDRYLADFKGHTVALAYQAMTFETAPWQTYDHDVRVEQILTVKEHSN